MSENHNDDKTQSFTPLTKDTIAGHYRILKKIGAGGMGEVYLAEDTELNRKVAPKFLPTHLCQDEDCRKRFKRKAGNANGRYFCVYWSDHSGKQVNFLTIRGLFVYSE